MNWLKLIWVRLDGKYIRHEHPVTHHGKDPENPGTDCKTLEKSIKDDVASFNLENVKEKEEQCSSLKEDWRYFMMTGLPGKMTSEMKSILKGSLKAR